MQKNENFLPTINDLSLVNPGKSSRLQAMRDKAVNTDFSALAQGQGRNSVGDTTQPLNLGPELMQARQAIDTRLVEIMALMPAGKQRRLFKIRYGFELEQIRSLPIKQLVKRLDIQLAANPNQATVMKLIGDLNYNGELTY